MHNGTLCICIRCKWVLKGVNICKELVEYPVEATVFIKAILKHWTDDFPHGHSGSEVESVKYVLMVAQEEMSKGHKNLYNLPSSDHEFSQQMSSKCSR